MGQLPDSALFGTFPGSIRDHCPHCHACDHYVAICKPLHYTTIMRQGLCQLLVVVVALTRGILHSTMQILFVMDLTFCGCNVIDNFMCDFFSPLEIACSDIYMLGMVVATNSGATCLLIFSMLLISYVIILSSLKSHGSEGQCKALSTCGSHFTVVVLFFCPLYFQLHTSYDHLPCRQVGECGLYNPHSHVKS